MPVGTRKQGQGQRPDDGARAIPGHEEHGGRRGHHRGQLGVPGGGDDEDSWGIRRAKASTSSVLASVASVTVTPGADSPLTGEPGGARVCPSSCHGWECSQHRSRPKVVTAGRRMRPGQPLRPCRDRPARRASAPGRRAPRSGSPRRAAKTCWPQRSAPARGKGSSSRGNQPTSAHSRGWAFSSPPIGPALEHQRIERNAADADAQPVEHGDQPDHLDVDAGLLLDLLDHHLGGRVAHVGPTGGVEPDAGVGPLDQQDLARCRCPPPPRPPPWGSRSRERPCPPSPATPRPARRRPRRPRIPRRRPPGCRRPPAGSPRIAPARRGTR